MSNIFRSSFQPNPSFSLNFKIGHQNTDHFSKKWFATCEFQLLKMKNVILLFRFITGTASSTDPPGVNWLWKKLGIENCKPTLPKFTQRYLMDNLDAAVAKAVLYDIKKLSKLQNRLPDVVQK